MQRRKFIASIGSVAAGAAAVTGTGAFTSVNADRNVAVSVADDSDALLRFTQSDGDNGQYTEVSSGEVSIDLDITGTSNGGAGVNRSATTKIFDIFNIENQGTQSAIVFASPSGIGQDALTGGTDTDKNGVKLDPQVTNMPNGIEDPDASIGRLRDGTPFTSLTNIGGTILSSGSSFAEATLDTDGSTSGIGSSVGPNPPEIYLLRPGESFEFGLQINADDDASTFNIDIPIVADAQLAKEAGL